MFTFLKNFYCGQVQRARKTEGPASTPLPAFLAAAAPPPPQLGLQANPRHRILSVNISE